MNKDGKQPEAGARARQAVLGKTERPASPGAGCWRGPAWLPPPPEYCPASATSTPQWYYILAESKIAAGGLNLGPVAAKIVAETLIGLLRADPSSYLRAYPQFRPFLGADCPMGPSPDTSITGNRSYTRAHFLYCAGVVTPGTYR